MLCHLAPLILFGSTSAAAAPPHIISILQDDLGYADTGVNGGPAAAYTQKITALAKAGIVLSHHYVHWHCSPTRRTFLSGRLPIHHGEQLSKVDTDDMDLRWTWLPQKLQTAGYRTHGFGKEHTGFRSVKHLWSNRGFTSSFGSLLTGGNYFYSSPGAGGPRWQDQHPVYSDAQLTTPPPNCAEQTSNGTGQCIMEYSTALWGQAAVQAVVEHRLPTPIYVHLCFQAVHTPYDAPPPGFRGPDVPGPPDSVTLEDAAGKCAPESADQNIRFNCPATEVRVPSSGASECCGLCAAMPSNCSHATMEGGVCSMWSGGSCQKLPVEGAFSFKLNKGGASPAPSPPGPRPMPVYRQMLWDADLYVGKLVDAVKAKDMWPNTLVFYSADNGGTGHGINWPLRGTKHTNWEGGLRGAAFISGGLVPANLRGTTNSATIHIADW